MKDPVLVSSYTKDALKRMKKQKSKFLERVKSVTDMMINAKKTIEKVFADKDGNSVNLPVAFQYIIKNIQGQQYINASSLVDITPLEAYEIIDNAFERLNMINYAKPTLLSVSL